MENKQTAGHVNAALYNEAKTPGEGVERLMAIISLLRRECPWDKEQTHETLRTCLLEESYEVCDAIDRRDTDNLEEELGDVLLQIVFHADIEEKAGNFDVKSLANRVSDKMIRRHPHIFSDESAKTVDSVLEKWESVKKKEKGERSHTEILKGIPKALPALTRSFKIQAKARDVGFDWDDVGEAFAKIEEETQELREAVREGRQADIEEEIGDLLFSAVNAARFLGVNPEEALERTSQKFIRRFAFIEAEAARLGRRMEDMTLEEMDAIWERAKKNAEAR